MILNKVFRFRLNSDECAQELYDVVFWVQSYFKATFIEENEELDEGRVLDLLEERTYEMLLLSLWVMHTYLPSEQLRSMVYKRFFKAVGHGSSDIGRHVSLEVFKQDLSDRLSVYGSAYDKVKFQPSEGVDQFGGMIARVIQYGTHPAAPTAEVSHHEVSTWYFRARVAINKWHNEISRRRLTGVIARYSDAELSHL